MSFGARSRAVLASLGTLGLALTAAASPASAAGGTPTTPTQLFTNYRSCSTDADRPTYLWGGDNLIVEGIPGTTDTSDNSQVSVQYQVWPVTDPAQTTTFTRDHATPGFEASGVLPSGSLAEGRSTRGGRRRWPGRGLGLVGPCYVTTDNSRPANAPTVSSPNYPPDKWNQGGEPAKFTLSANGVDDVTGFEYSWQQELPVISTTIGDHGIPQPSTRTRTRNTSRAPTPSAVRPRSAWSRRAAPPVR